MDLTGDKCLVQVV